MRRIFVITAALLLMAAVTITAAAAGGISASNAVGKAGQTVKITLSIDQSIKGDQVSVEYSYDDEYLTPQPSGSKWYPNGSLSNFHNIKNIGAWTASAPVELKGQLCSIAFLVKPGVSFESTAVSAKVTVLKDGKEVAKYTASGNVSTECIHNYGLWESIGEFSHETSCSYCGEKKTGNHSWDDGKQIADPNNASDSLMVYSCTECKATRQIPMHGVHTPATEPETTTPPTQEHQHQEPSRPTEPETTTPPTQEHQHQESSRPTEPEQYQEPTIGTAPPPETDPFTGEIINKEEVTTPTQSFVDYNEPEHTHVETTAPMYIEHDHDHTTEATEQERSARGALVLSIGIIFVVVLVYVVKKKS